MAHLSVSTVVPTYNRASLLRRALNTAVPQCEPGDEIVVVDDGSTDETEAVTRSFGSQVRYLRTPHLGAGAARNAGVRAASCDLVAFLDSDDLWLPWKLALQRTVLEQCPDILFLFSDFGYHIPRGKPRGDGLKVWEHASIRRWGAILGEGVPSATIRGLPAAAPRFNLHIGRLYDAFIYTWCVCTPTVMVRRDAAGDALHFPEDVPTYEDIECFARLARHGVAAFIDCPTTVVPGHRGPRLTDADPLTKADTALKIIDRVWGKDEEYLRLHREEYEAVMDAHRIRKIRYLLGSRRGREARQQLAELDFFHTPPRYYYLLTYVPGSLMGFAVGLRRSLYGLHIQLRS